MNQPRAQRHSTSPGASPGDAYASIQGEGSGVQEARAPLDGRHRDAGLQVFRRLDWRFLLHDPGLKHVAFLGDDDPQLTQGLRRIAPTLSLLDLHWRFPKGQEPRFDTVVLRSAHLHDADRASRLVDAGGCMYWEIVQPRLSLSGGTLRARLFPRPHARRAPRNLARLRRHLLKLGFTHVRFHWHRPSFHGAVEIVPLESDRILDFVLDGRGARLPGRVKRLGARCLRRLGLLRGWVPSMSVVACRRPCEEES